MNGLVGAYKLLWTGFNLLLLSGIIAAVIYLLKTVAAIHEQQGEQITLLREIRDLLGERRN